ncbi:NAD(P)/FAD-dependent oxidoreductase [Roseovarius aestuarii]|uniref:Hydrogen cyanide synthase subunit HcnC n=1 Tax=Roseovarius aestuarii TaxID=475083 RepID=A0A1X7BVC6_9RHOB|nr:FAD-binding oxidoreductase [Roseovarius aestuarii]SMC13621.1 Hydrogen cyanide synthase subunit HcnC precursor [Roseovarius aestuarii]
MKAPDIIVVGGGIAGVSAAALLAEDANVLVLEREGQPGYHATGRSAATFVRNYGNATLKVLNAAAEPILTRPDGIADSSLLSPRGALVVAGEDEVAALDAFAEDASGIERIDPDEAMQHAPYLRRDWLVAALYEDSAQDIDVDRLLQGYIRLLRARGGQIETDAEVIAIGRKGRAWQVATGTETYETPLVVNAAGAWADVVAAMAGVWKIGLQPCRRSAVLMKVPETYEDAMRWPLVISASETWYAKPDAGKLLISPADEDPVEPQDAWPDDMVLAEGLHRFEEVTHFPITRPTHSWAGLRSFVADRTPVVGFAPDAPGFFWLAGQGGYGVQTSPVMAALTHALCCGKTSVLGGEVVAALSPDRFNNQS